MLLLFRVLLRNLEVDIKLSARGSENPWILKIRTQAQKNSSDDKDDDENRLENSPIRGASKEESPQDAQTKSQGKDQAEDYDNPHRMSRERKETTHLKKYLHHPLCFDTVDPLFPQGIFQHRHSRSTQTMSSNVPHDLDPCLRRLAPRIHRYNHFACKPRSTSSTESTNFADLPNAAELPTDPREWSSPPTVEEALEFDERDRLTQEMEGKWMIDPAGSYDHPNQDIASPCGNSMMVQHGGEEAYASDTETDSRFDPYDLPTYDLPIYGYRFEPLDGSPNASFPAPLAVDPVRNPYDDAERWDHDEESSDDTQGWGSEAVGQTDDGPEGQSWDSDQPHEGMENDGSETSEEFTDVMDEAEAEGFTDVMSDKEEPQGHRLQDWKAAGREDEYW